MYLCKPGSSKIFFHYRAPGTEKLSIFLEARKNDDNVFWDGLLCFPT